MSLYVRQFFTFLAIYFPVYRDLSKTFQGEILNMHTTPSDNVHLSEHPLVPIQQLIILPMAIEQH